MKEACAVSTKGEPVSNVQAAKLSLLPMFAGMDPSALERITAGATELELSAGAALYRRGDSSNGLFLVIHGMLKLCLQAPHGAERVVDIVGPGGCFGESAFAGDSVHMLTAEAIAPAKLLRLSRAVVVDELARAPAFARWIVSSLTDRLSHVLQGFEDCTLRTGTERVAGYLIGCLPSDAIEGSAQVRLDSKKGTIASQLNLTQEHFSRILRDLSTRGIIEVHARVLNIIDVAQLKHLTSIDAARNHVRR